MLADDVDLHVAVSSADAGERRCDFRPQQEKKTAETVTDPQLVVMLSQFLLRGLHNVTFEWELLCTAYNLKRLRAGQTIEGRNHRAHPAPSQPDIRHGRRRANLALATRAARNPASSSPRSAPRRASGRPRGAGAR
jgi:hypothetical protein